MDLNKAQLERLAILAEECAEVQQVIGKILRHGFESYSPKDPTKETNKARLASELGDIMVAMNMLIKKEEVDIPIMLAQIESKSVVINKHLHHNKVDFSDNKFGILNN